MRFGRIQQSIVQSSKICLSLCLSYLYSPFLLLFQSKGLKTKRWFFWDWAYFNFNHLNTICTWILIMIYNIDFASVVSILNFSTLNIKKIDRRVCSRVRGRLIEGYRWRSWEVHCRTSSWIRILIEKKNCCRAINAF